MTDGEDPNRKPSEVRLRANNVVMLENAIARGSFKLSGPALKLFYVAAAAAQITEDEYTYVSLEIETLVPLLDPSRGSYTYESLFNWGRELRRSEIILEGEDEKSAFGWVTFVRETKTTLDLMIGPAMKDHILQLQKNFQRAQLSNMASFHGRHALRLYSILMSYAGQAKKGTWTVRIPLEELRWKLQVVNEYPKTGMFSKRCVYEPVQHINAQDVGIHVEVQRDTRRRRIVGYIFTVRFKKKTKEKVANPKPATPPEVAINKLIQKNPQLWEECLEEADATVSKQHELFTGEFAVPKNERVKKEAERLLQERSRPKKKKGAT